MIFLRFFLQVLQSIHFKWHQLEIVFCFNFISNLRTGIVFAFVKFVKPSIHHIPKILPHFLLFHIMHIRFRQRGVFPLHRSEKDNTIVVAVFDKEGFALYFGVILCYQDPPNGRNLSIAHVVDDGMLPVDDVFFAILLQHFEVAIEKEGVGDGVVMGFGAIVVLVVGTGDKFRVVVGGGVGSL